MTWNLRKAHQNDLELLADLRAEVLRPDLERLGRYDPARVRQRMRDSFAPEHTSVITIGDALAGCITFRPGASGLEGQPRPSGLEGQVRNCGPEEQVPSSGEDCWWLEHFYLAPVHQGRGLGSQVLTTVLDRAHGLPVRLNVLQGSPARRLYKRHGFVVERQDPVDVFMIRSHDRPVATALTIRP